VGSWLSTGCGSDSLRDRSQDCAIGCCWVGGAGGGRRWDHTEEGGGDARHKKFRRIPPPFIVVCGDGPVARRPAARQPGHVDVIWAATQGQHEAVQALIYTQVLLELIRPGCRCGRTGPLPAVGRVSGQTGTCGRWFPSGIYVAVWIRHHDPRLRVVGELNLEEERFSCGFNQRSPDRPPHLCP